MANLTQLSVPALAKTLGQTPSQVRRYFDHGIFFAHDFQGLGKMPKLGSAEVRNKAFGLLSRRLQRRPQLQLVGQHLKDICGAEDRWVLTGLSKVRLLIASVSP